MGTIRIGTGIGAGLTLALSAVLMPLQTPTSSAATHAKAVRTAHHYALPLFFEANRGQTDSSVRFLARGPGYTVFLTDAGPVFALRRAAPISPRSGYRSPLLRAQQMASGRQTVLRLDAVGAARHPSIVGLDRQPGIVNYLIGHTAHTRIPLYARVRYANLYPGIDLVFHAGSGGLEYDWVLRPGADVSRIGLRVTGAGRLSLDAHRDLVMPTVLGPVVQQRPRIYQGSNTGRRVIAGGFVVSGAVVRLTVARYDHARPLVIDPAVKLVYSTYLGGSADDNAYRVAVDTSGNAYVTNETSSLDFPLCPAVAGHPATCDASTASGSPAQPSYGGRTDAYVAKLNPSGTALVYATYLGGSDSDYAFGIAVDGSGSAYVTGQTVSTDFPLCPGSSGHFAACADTTASKYPLQSTFGGHSNAFVAKLNPQGTALVYSTYLGGTGFDIGYALAVDASGNAHVAGDTGSADFPVCPGPSGHLAACADASASKHPVQPSPGGDTDAFVAELNAAGTALIYSTYLGGAHADTGYGIAVDGSGLTYVAGDASTNDFPLCPAVIGHPHPCDTSTASGSPAQSAGGQTYIAKLNSAGTALIYSTLLGGGNEEIYDLRVDTAGDAYVTGFTGSMTFPACPGAGGHLATCADTNASKHPAQSSYGGGGSDAFVTEVNPTGTALAYSTYLGGSGFDEGIGIAVDASRHAYVTGEVTSADFPLCPAVAGHPATCDSVVTGSPAQSAYGGLTDAFVTEVNASGTALVYSTYLGGSDTDDGYGIAVNGIGEAYVTGVTRSSNFPVCPDNNPNPLANNPACLSHSGYPEQSSRRGPLDAFITKLSATVVPPNTPLTTVTATTNGCAGARGLTLSLFAQTLGGAPAGGFSFNDSPNRVRLATTRLLSLHREGNGPPGSGNVATIYAGYLQGVTPSTVSLEIHDFPGGACRGTAQLHTSSGYDSGIFSVTATVTTP